MNLQDSFKRELDSSEVYSEARRIILNNSLGGVWLIGGAVFRNLAYLVHTSKKPNVDLDFIVEHDKTPHILPEGWAEGINRFENPKFFNANKQIDLIPLSNIYSIISRNLSPTIGNFLSGVPLTMQALVYDVKNEKLIGEKGLDALQRKVVEVNDLRFAKYAAKKKGKSLRQYIQEKADELGFLAVFPTT